MGKNLIQQRRGKGSFVFRSPPGRKYAAAFPNTTKPLRGEIVDLVHSPIHSAPLAKIAFESGECSYLFVPEHMRVGDTISGGVDTPLENATIHTLKEIPEGTLIYNIEGMQGDGGKFVRAAGTYARVISRKEKVVVVELPSKKQREFPNECRAMIGVIAGSGRLEKPILKAGVKWFKMRARGRYWPVVCGQSMNAVAHPHGGKRSSKKNYPYSVSRHAPPGAKVGAIASRRTGRTKR